MALYVLRWTDAPAELVPDEVVADIKDWFDTHEGEAGLAFS